MNTLKGVFRDTKPKYRRNFVQENMRQLKEMQEYWQNTEKQKKLTVTRPANRYQNVPSRVGSRISVSQSRNGEITSKDRIKISKLASKTSSSNSINPPRHVTQACRPITQESRNLSQKSGTSDKDELIKDEKVSTTDSSPVSGGRTSRSLGCQTIDPKNINDLYEGVIKYPSSRKLPSPKKKQPMKTPPTREMGLQTERSPSPVVTIAASGDTPTCNDNNELDLQKLSLSQRSSDVDEPFEHIKQCRDQVIQAARCLATEKKALAVVPSVNYMKNTKGARLRTRTRTMNDPLKPPPRYQKGVVPKYLQERKEEWQKEAEQQIRDAPDPTCPPGHVSLPDSERIETLKMLRKSYGDLVQELNMMPVRTDTLRMQKRKMELEKQLNKIEQGIKIFSRPKVFVKIGA